MSTDGDGGAANVAAAQPPQPAANPAANTANPHPSAMFNIQLPEEFDFSKPQDWERWIRRFERYRLASNLHLSSEDDQVHTLIYCMGEEADDILRGLALTDAQREQYGAVKDSFETYFVPRKNVIYEREKFNQRVQQTETVDSFITAMYHLAENCGLGVLQQPYTIKLKPDAVPFCLTTPRRVPSSLVSKVSEELEKMESLGVISRMEEPTEWCSAMVPVPSKNGSLRICVDLTCLNEAVCREKYILPSVETLGSLAGARLFSKLDANRGFWQIPLSPESARYTTFITPFGCFVFNRLPFGIASAPEHFQRRMSMILYGLQGVVCHMADVLIWGKDQEEHNTRLHAVLNKLQETGVALNMEKCELSTHKVKFLGHILSDEGVQPDPDKTKAVRDMKEPSNTGEVRSFLGMVNQLGKFIPGLAEKDKPLRDLLSKKNQWVWSCVQQNAFDQLKNDLTSPPVLTLYDPNKELKLSADASSYGLGAVLLQKEGEQWRPVAYASRSMTETEQRYAQVEKKALGLTWGCERFRDFLIGRHFFLKTDHRSLISLLGLQMLTELPPRIQWFRLRLMLLYSYSISHTPGKEKHTADTLSRAPVSASSSLKLMDKDLMEDTNIYFDEIINSMPPSSSYLAQLRDHLKEDSVCSVVMSFCQRGWPDYSKLTDPVKTYWLDRDVLTVHDGLLLRGSRLVIPPEMRSPVLHAFHVGRQGTTRLNERLKETVWWPGLIWQLNELLTA